MALVKDRVETKTLQVPLEQMQKKTQMCVCLLISHPNPFLEPLDGQRTTEFLDATQRDRKFSKSRAGHPSPTQTRENSPLILQPFTRCRCRRGVGVLVVGGREFRSVARLLESCPTRWCALALIGLVNCHVTRLDFLPNLVIILAFIFQHTNWLCLFAPVLLHCLHRTGKSLALLPLCTLLLDHLASPLEGPKALDESRSHPCEPHSRQKGHSVTPQSHHRQQTRFQHMNPDHSRQQQRLDIVTELRKRRDLLKSQRLVEYRSRQEVATPSKSDIRSQAHREDD